MIAGMDERGAATLFKALGDENRVRILAQLRAGEQCACRLLDALDVSQPTLSHHMKVLCDAGLVTARKDGKWMYYAISGAGARRAAEALRELTAAKPGRCRDSCRCD